ncbi:uncharacterized protein LOC122805775 [Protopterus annectens]|uniref:uncharacterized protein LOC122805775 n=1 Tax=Protopterus annectens TaxID=7888 RepID=UPI001CFAEDD6|nr:uncharacterized protein LOC122805775 [Protopterus annectens]
MTLGEDPPTLVPTTCYVAPPTTTPGDQGPDSQGPTVVLPCYFSVDSGTLDFRHLVVLWQSKEKQVAKFADNILFNSRRAWLSVDELRKGNASLVLTNVSPADAGDYTCDVQYLSDTKPRVTVSLNAEDVAPPTITPGSHGADSQGPTVVLPCYFSVDSGTWDFRHLMVLWQSKEKQVAKFADNILFNSRRAWLSVDELRKGNASLVLTSVLPADAGDYTCDVQYLSDTKPRVTVSLNAEDIAPSSTIPGTNVTVGHTLLLPCYFSVDSGTPDLHHLVVEWEFNKTPLVSFTDNILFNTRRAWLFADELRKGNASLVLTSVSPADKGDYTCNVRDLSGKKPKVTVSLTSEDVAPPTTTPDSQGADYQGPTVVLPCYFSVDSGTVDLDHLVVLWQSKEKQVAKFADNILFNSRRAWLSVDELRKGNASLVLTDVSPGDGGDYTCDVKYLSDTKPRVTVSLNAEDIAPSSTIPGTNVTVGHTVLLPCYFSVDSGTPNLHHLVVEWEFNKTPLARFTDNILFNSRRAWLFADELRKGNASLVLTNVSPADKGDYTCNIRDLLGKKPKVTVSLTSEDLSPPSTTPDSKGADHHGHAVLLPCYFSVDSETVNLNQLVVQWQHGENDIAKFMNNNLFIKRRAWLSVDGLKKGNASLLLFDVSPADTGDYTCDVNYISDTKPKVTVSLNKDDVSPPRTTPGIDDTHQHGHTVLLPCYFRFDSATADLNHLVVQWESQGNPVAKFSKNSLFIKRRAWLSVDELKKGNASLVLTNVSPADEGDYTCDVKYLSDTKSRMDIALRTEDGKPETFIRGPSVRDRERSTVLLPCYFTIESGTMDFSHLVVEWEFQGYHVARFENKIMYKSIAASLSEDELRKGNASLTLTSVSPKDEGDYICDVTYLSDTKAKVIVTLNVDAIDCGTLPDINNGNAEYINGTGFGSVVYFHCNEGYKLIGSNYRTCLTAEWDQQSPQCIRMRCEKPSSIPDGEYELEETVNSQTVAIYRCTKGFLIGEGKLQCTNTGIWKGNLPSCRDIICGGPPLVPHGAYELKFKTSEGDAESEIVATYTCDKGHIVGHDTLVCTSSGTWSEPKPSCKVECDEPPTLENAYIYVGGRITFPIGTKLTYRCRPGYTGLQSIISCHKTAKWTRPRSTCKPRSCGSLEDLPNGRIEFEGGITFGAVARFYCDDGYNLIGRSYRTCLADGWDYQNPSCEALTCDEPPSIKDGTHDLYFNGGDIQLGQVVTYKCQKGKLVGEKSIFCTSKGTWSGDPPKCIVSKCPNIDVQHGRKTSNFGPNYEYGDLVTYDCKRGYNLRGSSQIKCEENDIWTPAPPTCEIKDCGPLPAIMNGRITYKTGTTFGSSALFNCDIGYKIHGSYYRKCDDDGWDSTNPICEEVSCKEPHVENGIKISDNASVYYYDDKITFECKPRFEMKGKPTIRCNERGEWSPETPKCTVKSELCIAVEERKKFYQCGMSWDKWTSFLAQEKLYLEIRKLKLLEKRYSKIAVMKKYISDMSKKYVNEI